MVRNFMKFHISSKCSFPLLKNLMCSEIVLECKFSFSLIQKLWIHNILNTKFYQRNYQVTYATTVTKLKLFFILCHIKNSSLMSIIFVINYKSKYSRMNDFSITQVIHYHINCNMMPINIIK